MSTLMRRALDRGRRWGGDHPSRVPVIELGKEEGMAIAHGLDFKGEVLKARTKWFFGLNLLADRSPELYREIADTETMTS